MPSASARCELAWMIGPSAIGSENGTPSSITSAPDSASAARISTVRAASGYPAVTYGTSARLPAARSCVNCRETASDEVITDPDAIAIRVFGLDDGARERALGVALRQVDDRPRMEHVAEWVAAYTHDRSR